MKVNESQTLTLSVAQFLGLYGRKIVTENASLTSDIWGMRQCFANHNYQGNMFVIILTGVQSESRKTATKNFLLYHFQLFSENMTFGKHLMKPVHFLCTFSTLCCGYPI